MLGLFSFEETRQIVHGKEWEPVLDVHQNALDHLMAGGIAVDTIVDASLVEIIGKCSER
ncbi:MAG TPA: hypothetical protein VMQ46_01095 [Acidimicrobiia bacterium]|nr:hypothetical protein [Acidimicrobiia bacterium]